MLNGMYKRVLAIAICAALGLGAIGCGGQNKGKDQAVTDMIADRGSIAAEGYTYEPEVTLLEENIDMVGSCVVGDVLYCLNNQWDEQTQISQTSLRKYSLKNGLEQVGEEMKIDISDRISITRIAADDKGNTYFLGIQYGENKQGTDEEAEGPTVDFSDRKFTLIKYDDQGNVVYENDVTDPIVENANSAENAYVNSFAVDAEGRICMCSENALLFFDAEGAFKKKTNVNAAWIDGVYTTRQGKSYVNAFSQADYKSVFSEIDFERGEVLDALKDFPETNGGLFDAMDETHIMVAGQQGAYLYDLEKQESTKLFNWLDYDIIRDYIQKIIVVDENKIILLNQNWDDGTCEMVQLNKVAAGDVKEKQEITVGCMYEDYELKNAIVKFNKMQSDYHVRMKTYVNFDEWSENSYTDALNAFKNDLLSKDSPDIVSIDGLNVTELAKKGAFADLGNWLDQSDKLDRTDYFEQLLDQCAVDGKLITIPYTFSLVSLAGKTEDVGTKQGWTLQEMLELLEKNPEKQLYVGATRDELIYMIMQYALDDFVNVESGECHFDSEDFKSLLNIAKRYPSSEDLNYDDIGPMAIEIAKGNVLLNYAFINSFSEVQYNNAVFGNQPITYIGYPTQNGDSGCFMNVSNAYAITEKSDQKDAAWAFLEYVLSQEVNERDMYSGFSSRKSAFEKQKEYATKIEYLKDPETGEVLKDENGEPIVENAGGSMSEMSASGETWEYTYHVTTDEEVAVVEQLMSVAKIAIYNNNEELMKIITEEAAPYFEGQKSVEEVVDIIQSRISLYVMENR